MKTKTLILTLVLVAAIVAPLAIAAPQDTAPRGPRGGQDTPGQGSRGQMGRGDGNIAQMILGRMGEELNLTDAQKESIKKIAEESRTTGQESREAVEKAMQNLNEAAENGTEKDITAAGKTAGEALTKQAIHNAETAKKVKAVLDKEQLAKLEEMKAKMKERMEQRREQMRDGNGPQRGEGRPGGHGPRSDAPDDDAN